MNETKTQTPQKRIDNAKCDVTGFLAELQGVRFEMDSRFQELLLAVQDTQKKGSLTIPLTVEPLAKGGPSAIVTHPSIKTNVPRADLECAIRFVSDDGRLLKDDPRQLKFAFTKPTTEDKE